MSRLKMKFGFRGEKMISLPEPVWKKAIKLNPILAQLFVTHIGYFPKAEFHFRERKRGCADNILIYCVRGKGWYSIDGKIHEVNNDEFVIIPATKSELKYGADEADPWTIYWVHFSGKDMGGFNRSFGIGMHTGAQKILPNEKGIALWESMYRCLEKGYSMENLNYTNLCLYNLVASFLYPEKQSDEKKQDKKDLIGETIQYMRNHVSEKITISEMAERCSLSEPHFNRLFREATGMSPMDYFIHLKLQKSCLMLYSSGLLIKDVAAAVGYEDPYYFSRLFKKHMQISPENYRLMRRKE